MTLFFPDDAQRIVRICADRGIAISETEATKAWEDYSESLSARWMRLPEKDDGVFSCVQEYLPDRLGVADVDEVDVCEQCHAGAAVPGFAYCFKCTRETLDWVRQTVHRAYHGEHPLDSCPKDTCSAIRKLLGGQ